MDNIKVYTDGSNKLDQVSSWAFIAVQDDKIIHQDSGILTGEICQLRNIAGELKAAVEAIKWAKVNNYKIEIWHDLEGIERWGTGKWKCNNKWTMGYKKYCQENLETILAFRWVKGHIGEKYNEIVDELAGDAIAKYLKGYGN